MNGQFREALAIEPDVGLFQTINQLAVTHATHFCGGRNTGDPETTEKSLLHTTIAKRKNTCTKQGLFADLSNRRRPPTKPLVALNKRFLARRRGTPLLALIVQLPVVVNS